ncbi:bifunctional [glutamate--ammonia ligase]-adenylyl-L-tyrosine phosphorylase/[glutamate--ammonia-ligase] adenylyltransferase [Pseudoalteromonas tunicata]|uniref:bifunctional [glutamate--ammonia ligase]-adenylyl-L-tyrosine phosphorylase/[glutamate--ammonia-ligase] adenylyltransferase n=1 Tax=Pseudoalteromonas tunicata TaxID=314281 RepID=UPI00273F8978|nr:bifunctional [glutamate--ammonia ligase]-adenylyl-L-tyrosine phosphorylase/[glutamate--ammonia-ligase] adenylyltransferase [Pseudoalteromonas tunicata]MDP5211830.1 bifunctional [glutamate--ammonia ligase]-adenylyl-L-tyrosine phosphorylase/[glutamate--ammonia-ligase] adenylyltransferase [Pseudoalteromonas tunicata]
MDKMQLVEPLLSLGQKRFSELFAQRVPHNDIVQLLALSDFAYQVLASDSSLIEWLLDEQQCQSRAIVSALPDDLVSLDEKQCFQLLRRYRQRYWLKVAYLDLVRKNPIDDSIAYISKLSDQLIDDAYRYAYQQVAITCGMPIDKQGEPMPMLILGMGKLGGFELNYSSDIDLIFSYPYQCDTQGGRRAIEGHVFFTKVAQKVIAALNQVTPDGQVFRVDMRLRPFGESGPLVMSFTAVEEYYQEQGRDWERYAMLKARLIGQKNNYWPEFYALLKPFVYRRYIDFSVIESLRKMKAMIAQEVRRKGLKGNIKLGSGGIREVEFVVQAFQMIRGGREATLQTQSLLLALQELVTLEAIALADATKLKDAYLFLRKIEQYLQIFNNEQTQTLPIEPLNQARLCCLLAVSSYDDVLKLIDTYMQQIHGEFSVMVGVEKEHQDDEGGQYDTLWNEPDFSQLELSWGADNEQAWQNVLFEFKQQMAKKRIGSRGRDILDKLMPQLLHQLVVTTNDVNVLKMTLAVIEQVASRTAYLELLYENLGALKQLIKLCSHSRWIGEHLARYPILLDELIDPAILYRPLALNAYRSEIRQYFLRIEPQDLELQMEALRQFKQTHQLRIAAADATHVIDIMKVSDHLTALAEAIVEQSVEIAWQHMVTRFGYPQGADEHNKGFAVIAYGKAGGLELGYDSDLDLVFVHNSDATSLTNGDKQIDSRQFYLKLAQRLMHLFNTRTSSGILYELDPRLRPEGASGLLAINIETFGLYQNEQAWTWEHQALVRTRMIYGQESLQQRFSDIRHQVLALVRDKQALKVQVREMREKMREHLAKGDGLQFDLKQDVGGMADIEFIAQYLVLAYAAEFKNMTQWSDNIRIFTTASELDIISESEAQQLIHAYCFYREHYHILSLRQQDKLVLTSEVEMLKQQVITSWQKYLAE